MVDNTGVSLDNVAGLLRLCYNAVAENVNMQGLMSGYSRMREPKRKLPSDLRRGLKTAADLKDAAESLGVQAGNLLSQAKAMDEELKIKALTVDGQTKWDRGMKLINEFVANVDHAIIDARKARMS